MKPQVEREDMRVSWIGVGLMGLPMCSRVLAAGHHVTMLRRGAVETLAAAGADIRETLKTAIDGADLVVTVLPTPTEVRDVYLGTDGVLHNAASGTVCVDMTTSSPQLAFELAQAAASRRIGMVDAPVSGGPFGAERGVLSVMVGGDEAAVKRARPILECVGDTIVHHGSAGAGQRAKLANQILVAGVTHASCEAFALVQAAGMDANRVLQSIRSGAAGSALVDYLWGRLSEGDTRPGFKLGHLCKDLDLALEEATGRGLALSGVELARAATRSAIIRSGADAGTQAIIGSVSPLTLPPDPKCRGQ